MNWVWLIAGIVLILSEFIIPGFVICFFGAAALIVGVLQWIFPLSLVWQLLLFALLGVFLLVVCRRFMPGVFRGTESAADVNVDDDGVAGENCICRAAIVPGIPGKVEFRGSLWSAVADENISDGELCAVISRNNLTLKVCKKQS